MKQILIDEQFLVSLDYDSDDYSPAVKQFRPTLYKNGELFCCILGPEHEQAIEGCGATEDEALEEWEKAFTDRLHSKGNGDEVVQYIRDTLAISKKDVW